MIIKRLETLLANSGLRNYLFVRLTTDTGLSGIGEASLEWQEQTVRAVLHEWVEGRVLGRDPRDIEAIAGDMLRDQYQGGATVLTAISGVEIALWDLLGKSLGVPVYQLLGGRARAALPAYANGWYGGATTPEDYAERACDVAARGYRGMKFDPFGTAWKGLTREQLDEAEARVAAVRAAIGPRVELLIEGHGRLAVADAIAAGRRLAKYDPAFFEEPVTPWSLDLLLEAKRALPMPIAAGERLYMLEDFWRACELRAMDVLQPDLAHCGGLAMGKKIAAMAQARDLRLSPHVSVGPVALCAALHFGWATPQVWMQENFAEYDVPWRDEFVCGWNPARGGEFALPEGPGMGLELDEAALARHPYEAHSFPSLWDGQWITDFTQKDRKDDSWATRR